MAIKVLFFRDYQNFTGGHLKVWNYFKYLYDSENFDAKIIFTPNSKFDTGNPWKAVPQSILLETSDFAPDLLFVEGTDWEQAKFFSPKPTINLIQGFRHLNPNLPLTLYDDLSRFALRICVSQELALALSIHPQVNGPVFYSPNGINSNDFDNLPSPDNRTIDWFISGYKNKEAATAIANFLTNRGERFELATNQLERNFFLEKIKKSRNAVFLPSQTEGFYLPALEAMASQTFVICPDVIGNRTFCIDGVSCLLPDYSLSSICKAIDSRLSLSDRKYCEILATAKKISTQYNLNDEKIRFLKIIDFALNHLRI